MSFTLDEMTSAIQSQTGLPYEKARAVAAQNLGGQTGQRPVVEEPKPKAASPNGEKGEQLAIKRSAIARGAFVYEFSQARATNQTPGIPDLYLVWPTHALWWECKTATGVLSQPQARFMAQCLANGTPHGVGTHADFLDWWQARTIAPLAGGAS